jgi:hypothetical protein
MGTESVGDSCVSISWPLVSGSFAVADTSIYQDSIGGYPSVLSVNNTVNSWTSSIHCAKILPTNDIESIAASSDIVIYPVPSHLHFHVRNESLSVFDICIYNLLGERVKHIADISGHENLIDVSSLIPGIYIAEIRFDGVVKAVKLNIN